MNVMLWQFIDNKGTFSSQTAHTVRTLYFPLCNQSIMSSITPFLHGDCKTDNNSFILEPVSRINLINSQTNRNFWIYINPRTVWSLAGTSKEKDLFSKDIVSLEAGLLWHSIKRTNKHIGLSANILSFIPSNNDPVEIMCITLTNISKKRITFTPTAAIPLYCRSADTLRDHRQVTSLLQRITKDRYGITVSSTLVFDETGHKKDSTNYCIFGFEQDGKPPLHIYPSQEEFTGDAGDLTMPEAIFRDKKPDRSFPSQGKEPMGALKFNKTFLKPNKSITYCVVLSIIKNPDQKIRIFNTYKSYTAILNAFKETKNHWENESSKIIIETGNQDYDNWFKWVSIQPILRKIFGCSFLPDFDYGKGGRGWRDIWQDALALIFTDPGSVRPMLINNFSGVRIDGSNATIIGKKPGEFIADRNRIPRVWMDHGAWPVLTTLFYIHQTGDSDILLEQTPYFKDCYVSRSREIDTEWSVGKDTVLKTSAGDTYQGTVLEHMLVQNLVQFFNVGSHNHIRLEHADWNDGLDMAYEHGESVAFTSLYAYNLKTLSSVIENLPQQKISLCKELYFLLDTISTQTIDYANLEAKQARLERYFAIVKHGISGEKADISKSQIIHDLNKKADWMIEHIRTTEWLKEGFFNSYYDNDKKPVEGTVHSTLRMTLTGQVFAIMSGIASDEQIKAIFNNAKKYLRDKKSDGFRLNTDFKQELHSLGRAFSFSYGDKENGAFFNHMSVMFAYALYMRGYVHEGYEVLHSIYSMAANSAVSKIYPCLPEYFNNDGRGMYSYLTGSASWYIVTMLTQVFGVRGEYGDLVIEPKLVKKDFKKNIIAVRTVFAERNIEIIYTNPKKKDFGEYTIKKLIINSEELSIQKSLCRCKIPRSQFIALATAPFNTIEVLLD